MEIETDKQYKDIASHAAYTERLIRSRHYWSTLNSSSSESEEENESKSEGGVKKQTEAKAKTIENSGPVTRQQAAKTKEVSGC